MERDKLRDEATSFTWPVPPLLSYLLCEYRLSFRFSLDTSAGSEVILYSSGFYLAFCEMFAVAGLSFVLACSLFCEMFVVAVLARFLLLFLIFRV